MSQGVIPFREEIIAWAREQLRNAPLAGTRKAMVTVTNTNSTNIPFVVTKGGGTAEVISAAYRRARALRLR